MQELTRTLSLSDCLNHTFSCSCGHTHRAELEAVYIGKGTLKELPKWLEKKGYIKAYIICDPITKEIAGDQTKKELEEKKYPEEKAYAYKLHPAGTCYFSAGINANPDGVRLPVHL